MDRQTCKVSGCDKPVTLSDWTGEPRPPYCQGHWSVKEAGLDPEEY